MNFYFGFESTQLVRQVQPKRTQIDGGSVVRKPGSVWLKALQVGSVLTGFLPSFPSQIRVGGVTFVTFFGDKKCDASLSPVSNLRLEAGKKFG